MALTNTGSGGGGATYVTLYKGYWGERSDESTEGTVSRERGGTGDNSKDIIWEKRYDTLSGKITNAYLEESKFGENLMLVLDDNGEVVMARMKSTGKLGESIQKTFPNIDVTSDVQLKAYINKQGYSSLWIEQAGEGVKWAFTKESPNGMPQPIVKTVKGKEVYDWSDVTNFIYESTQKWCTQFEGAPVKEEDKPAVEEDMVF